MRKLRKFFLYGLLVAGVWICSAPASNAGEVSSTPNTTEGVNTDSALPAPPDAPVPGQANSPIFDEDPAENQDVTTPQPAAPASHTAPYLAKFADISAGDTAWMISATALVLLMTIPGLVLFYSGMVRKKNVLSTALQSFATCCLVSIIWVVIGYSIAFTPGSTPFLGGVDRFMLYGLSYLKESNLVSVSHIAPTIPESVFIMFQMTFAIITPALIIGAFAERIRITAMLMFMGLWSVLVYSPIAHWMWEPSGYFASHGVLDFAGGTVVHINAGIAGLVCAYYLKPRTGYGKIPLIPYNLVYTLVGASLLWVGWFGFNAGSALTSDGRAGLAMLVTQTATAVAATTWITLEWLIKNRITVLGCASGAVSGLVAITPASGFVGVDGALIIGLSAGAMCYWGATGLKSILGADDSLDVFGIHGIGGLVGAILTGVFAEKAISGLEVNLWMQCLAAFSTLLYSGVMTYIILIIVNFFARLRVDVDDEEDGLDISQHSERIS